MLFLIKAYTNEVEEMYKNHPYTYKGDSGLDLFIPENTVIPAHKTILVDLQISCQLTIDSVSEIPDDNSYRSYLMYPRSSIYKSPLRISNSVGVCDQGYTGHLFIALDNISDKDYLIHKGQRYAQLCSGNLDPINFKVVKELRKDTERGTNGFGSTGK